MAIASSITQVVVTGTYVDFLGVPITGQIRFSITDVLRDGADNQIIAPSTVVVPLVNGAFSVTLPATNDPDVIPAPFFYNVEETFSGGRSYQISLPYTGGPYDLAVVSPDVDLPSGSVQLVDSIAWGLLSNNIEAQSILVASESALFGSIGSSTTTAQGYAVTAAANLVTAQNNANATINSLLLIGG